MIPERPHNEPPAHRDRRTRLLVLGALLVLLGCGAVLLGGLVAVSLVLSRHLPAGSQLHPAQMVPSLLVYPLSGAGLITLGIGSIRCRRWARPLVLILGWSWLVMGLATGALVFGLLPTLFRSMPSADPRVTHVMVGCMAVVDVLLGIAVPTLLVTLYRGRDVRATFETLDPTPRWTDRVPTPLLGLSLWMAFAALGMLATTAYGVFPAGPVLLTGAPAVAIDLALAALWAYFAIGLARRSRGAWWAAVVTSVVTAVWALFAFPRTDFAAMQRAMGVVAQPGVPDFVNMYRSPWFLGFMAFAWVSMLGYLLFVRRYLK